MQYSMKYIFLFAGAICLVCSLLIAIPAVALKPRQELNLKLDQQKAVLIAARLTKPGEKLSADKVQEMFKQIEAHVIDIQSGDVLDQDPATYDVGKAQKTVLPAGNPLQLVDVPRQVKVYQINKDGKLDMLVLPIMGKGLWSTLFGYLALDADLNTVEGITYYQHAETPGLGGEVDNPKWKGRWPGRKIYGETGEVAITVIKGPAGPIDSDPHHVDGLSGATLTARGVSNMLQFWFGEQGYGPYLKKLKNAAGRTS